MSNIQKNISNLPLDQLLVNLKQLSDEAKKEVILTLQMDLLEKNFELSETQIAALERAQSQDVNTCMNLEDHSNYFKNKYGL